MRCLMAAMMNKEGYAMSKTETLMRHVGACTEAALSCARAERDCATYEQSTDDRKHYAAIWCALRDMIRLEIEPDEVEWVESEESMRGAPLREVLRNNCATAIWHSKKPVTSNPVWEVRGNSFTALA